jgi:hypothetical protein
MKKIIIIGGGEAINYTRCRTELCEVCDGDQVFENRRWLYSRLPKM